MNTVPVDPWSLSGAALGAYKNREAIFSTWSRIDALLRGRKSSIGVTGMAGVGKTVLLDHLSGKAFGPSYKPPPESRGVERGRVPAHRQRLKASVIPGQENVVRPEGLESLFRGRRPVHGVVHVVCAGFTLRRDPFAQSQLTPSSVAETLVDYRRKEMAAEVEDFEETAEYLRYAIRRHRAPTWLLVVVNKADLYKGMAADVREHYQGSGDFRAAVERFVDKVGADNVAWDCIPTCAWLEPFVLGEERVESAVGDEDRRALLGYLTEQIEERCKARK